jgi:6-phosphogluconolactonase/glucosamine-6-phosphate isomerase/deaminase
MSEFTYQPSRHVPFRDMAVLERVRAIPREKLCEHPSPNYRIAIYRDDEIEFRFLTDLFYRIKTASDNGEPVVLILPQPYPSYEKLAYMINLFKVDCRKLYTFNLDEYADENGNIAPESWPFGFTHCLKKHFYGKIDPRLRPPESQMVGLTDENFADYGKMIADLGGGDVAYTGPGWTGHLAFIEPDAPEFDFPLQEWEQMGPTICTLSPFTIAQNSLHGAFGKSGDLAMVPPKAATIGPKQIIDCKFRIQLHAISVNGTATSWQRLISRLVMHGPVTPKVPESIHQKLRTDVWVSDTIAQNIEPDWNTGY